MLKTMINARLNYTSERAALQRISVNSHAYFHQFINVLHGTIGAQKVKYIQ